MVQLGLLQPQHSNHQQETSDDYHDHDDVDHDHNHHMHASAYLKQQMQPHIVDGVGQLPVTSTRSCPSSPVVAAEGHVVAVKAVSHEPTLFKPSSSGGSSPANSLQGVKRPRSVQIASARRRKRSSMDKVCVDDAAPNTPTSAEPCSSCDTIVSGIGAHAAAPASPSKPVSGLAHQHHTARSCLTLLPSVDSSTMPVKCELDPVKVNSRRGSTGGSCVTGHQCQADHKQQQPQRARCGSILSIRPLDIGLPAACNCAAEPHAAAASGWDSDADHVTDIQVAELMLALRAAPVCLNGRLPAGAAGGIMPAVADDAGPVGLGGVQCNQRSRSWPGHELPEAGNCRMDRAVGVCVD